MITLFGLSPCLAPALVAKPDVDHVAVWMDVHLVWECCLFFRRVKILYCEIKILLAFPTPIQDATINNEDSSTCKYY